MMYQKTTGGTPGRITHPQGPRPGHPAWPSGRPRRVPYPGAVQPAVQDTLFGVWSRL